MNNMYDILAKMKLLEGKGSKPDFLDLDKDGDKKEPMKKAAKEVDESVEEGSTGDYSAKKARAGKDIGKPGKQFSKIAADAAKRYGSKERGEKVAGAVLAKLRKGVKEDDVGEGNEFSGELAKAKATGAKSFRVDGKEYPVKESITLVRVLEGNDRRAEVFVDREYDEYQIRLHNNGMMSRHFTEAKADALSMAEAFVSEALDMNLLKAMQKGAKPGIKDPESERNIHKKYGYRSDRDDDGGEDDDYDEWGNLKAGKKKAAHVVPGEKRGRGRPKGSGGGKRLGAKSTGLSKLARGAAIREEEVEEAIGDPENTGQRAADRKQLARDHKTLDRLERNAVEKAKHAKLPSKEKVGEDYDKDEYDEEGEMAKSFLRTIEDAAEELQSILGDDENLPEWVQKKITLAKEYVDTARDYLKANRPEEEMMAEKAVSKAQRAAAGIAYAAKKGDIPKSELRGASKEMAKMDTKELKKFAKTKEKGLPEKKDEAVDETTSGSVATAPAEAPKGKKGMVFGKGVYEGKLEESFQAKISGVLNEDITANMTVSTQGEPSVTVTATAEDAAKLGELLKLAGLFGSSGYHKVETGCPMCGGQAGVHEAGCSQGEMVEEDLANSADNTEYADTDTMVNKLAGGLNGPKRQINPNNLADNPLAMSNLGKAPSGQINLGAMSEQVIADEERRLLDLYKRIQ